MKQHQCEYASIFITLNADGRANKSLSVNHVHGGDTMVPLLEAELVRSQVQHHDKFVAPRHRRREKRQLYGQSMDRPKITVTILCAKSPIQTSKDTLAQC